MSVAWFFNSAEIGEESNLMGFWIFRKIEVVASTLRDFLDWTKILYRGESITDV